MSFGESLVKGDQDLMDVGLVIVLFYVAICDFMYG
jgi:hypothetical protein